MKKTLLIVLLFGALKGFSQKSNESNPIQNNEFSSVEPIAANKMKVEVLFSNISSREDMDNIINSLSNISGVESVELFYPVSQRGIIILTQKVNHQVIIDKLSSINIQLDSKSLK